MHALENDENSCSKGGVDGFATMNSQLSPQYPRPRGFQLGSLVVDGGGFKVVRSMGMDHQGQGKMGSSLGRQNSSPPGLFSGLTSQSDLTPSSRRLKNHMNLLSRLPSSLGTLSCITEVENENGGADGLDDTKGGNTSGNNLFSSFGLPFSSWNDPSHLRENFACHVIRRDLDNNQKLFANTRNTEAENMPYNLSHHLSLPKNSVEMVAMKKLLQLQDMVPCKVCAKRGCATHPRSIAERFTSDGIRNKGDGSIKLFHCQVQIRTKINETMRKLQEHVPSMDKQINTADMVDLAVDYIKSVQKQYKTLSDKRANCKCRVSRR